jgi:protein involved in polysaccharide export with SLBB domain
LNDNENISALQALSMAGGATAYAALKNARILRPVQGAQDRQQIAVDLSRVIHGKVNDSALKADDILYVPGNMAKNVGVKAIEQAIQLGTGLIIWR